MPTISIVAIVCFIPFLAGLLVWEYLQFRFAHGSRLLSSGELEEAISNFERAIPLARLFRNSAAEVASRNNIGVCYLKVGNFRQSADAFREALVVMRARAVACNELAVRTNLAVALASAGEKSAAIEEASIAVALADSQNRVSDVEHLKKLITQIQDGSMQHSAEIYAHL